MNYSSYNAFQIPDFPENVFQLKFFFHYRGKVIDN